MNSNQPSPPPKTVANTEQLAATIGEQLRGVLESDEVATMDAKAIVGLVLDGINTVQSGDPLGTIRRDSDGIIYVRVSDSGVHKWRVIDPADGGANAFDMRSVDYPILYKVT